MRPGLPKFLLKTIIFILPVIIGFFILYRLGYTPIVTSSMYLDHKMFWLRQHPIRNPRVMAIGSSMTLYSIDSRTFTAGIHAPYFNFASWNTQIGDTKFLLENLLDRYHPGYVIICATIGDFAGVNNPSFANFTRSGRFILDWCPQLFYLTEFHSIHQIVWRRYRAQAEYVDFDPWGGGVGYMAPPHPDSVNAAKPRFGRSASYLFASPDFEQQYEALDSLCQYLRARKTTLIFAQTPVKASFLGTDSLQRLAARHFDRCRELIRRRGGIYLNYSDTTTFTDKMFGEPMHLTETGARLFTQKLVADLKDIIN